MRRALLFFLAVLMVGAGYQFYRARAVPSGSPPLDSIAELRKSAETARAGAVHRQLELAVLSAEANAQCGMSRDEGYAHYAPGAAAERLVRLMNAAAAPMPGEPEPPGRAIPYVLDRPTGDWQVVVVADEAAQQLRIDGYAEDLQQPSVSRTVACR